MKKRSVIVRLRNYALLAPGLVLPAAPGLAQTQEPSAESAPRTVAPDADETVAEIIVTARRREENLQTVPVSITAFTAEALEQRSLESLSDVASRTPNVIASAGSSGSSSSTSYYIRGIGQFDFVATTDPGVGLYIDGVYFARQTGNNFDLNDVELVEVLKGPQGTLFGKNTIGGAIVVTTRRPSGDTEGFLEVTTGRFNRLDLKGRIEFPLVPDKLAAMVSLARETADGYAERADGQEMSDRDAWLGRASIYWTPSDRFDWLLSVDGSRRREKAAFHTIDARIIETDNSFGGLQAYNAFIATPAGTPYLNVSASCPSLGPATECTSPYAPTEKYTTQGTGPNRSDLDVLGVTSNMRWSLGNATLRSITGYRHQHSLVGWDGDASPLTIAHQSPAFDVDQFSQEFQLLGKAVDDRLDWQLGLYYFHERSLTDYQADFLIPGIGVTVDNTTKLTTNSYAAFGQGTFAISDRLSVTGGIRYSVDKKRIRDRSDYLANGSNPPSSTYGNVNDDGTVTYLPLGTIVRDKDDWADVSPKLSVEYRASPGAFLYASLSKGYKSGSFGGRARAGTPGPYSYDEETAWTSEVGAKLDLFGRRARLNGALFRTVYTDMQLSVTVQDGTISNGITQNVGKAVIQGFELEGSAKLSRRTQIDGSIGFTDAEFDEFTTPPTGCPTVSSCDFELVSRWTANVGAQHAFNLQSAGTITLRADANYRSKVYFGLPNNEESSQPGYALVNARISYETADGAWQGSLFVTNLTDKYYRTSSFFGLGYATVFYGPPRQWGASLRRNF